ncbi:ABC transporter permease [Flagellimonas algicola]|uniref:ABC transporter permease n=1 Tax=Flagellimonas algicola TaxID=2583815 RepID=A0ABY2WR57_9FLAO|nr:ABC transporter permease subunit [Allomuricauda algicola]TMU57202.1 ABC transporter permease [Allomuricauda algicola]
MVRLLHIEFIKLWNNRTSRILILTSFIFPFSILILSSIKIPFFGFFTLDLGKTGIFNVPIIWHISTFFIAFFKIFFAIVVVSMIGNEYSNRTIKQNLIDGLSKKEFILSKFYFILTYSLISSIVVFLITLIIALFHSSYTEMNLLFRGSEFVLAYFFKLVGFFSLCFFLGVLIKRSAFALGFLFISFIVEMILYALFKWKWFNDQIADQIMQFFPFTSLWSLINQPIQRVVAMSVPEKQDLIYDYSVHWHEVLIVVGWTGLFIYLSYVLLKKRDL